MASLLRMPEVAAAATSAVLLAWNRQAGDAVAVGDVLAEIESDKAVVEYEVEEAGTIGQLLLAAGEEADVGTPIAVLLSPGETMADAGALLASLGGDAAAAAGGAGAVAAGGNSAAAGSDAPVAAAAASAAGATAGGSARIFASPLARRLAKERGIDLAGVSGSGPRGRIVKRDIEAAKAGVAAGAAAGAIAAAVPGNAESPYVEIPHSGMRRTIARRLSESKASIPHFYLSVDCRVDRLLALRAEFNATAARKVSINDFIVRAVAVALREVPEANVAWTDSAMRQFAHADIAVAVATDEGLITPIVRAADAKPVSAISAEIADLAGRARAGKLKSSEYQGGSFSVSNLGMYGVDEFSAIVNPPQAAILAVGAVQRKPVVEGDALVVGSVLRCTLSVDHRAIDGALAGRWLAEFRRVLEAPMSLLT